MSGRKSGSRMGGRAGLGAGASVVLGSLAIGACAGGANATWSILIADTRTGEVALASATCLTGFNLRHNTPVLITGVGGATAQSVVDQTGQNRGVIRDMLLQGAAPSDILAALAMSDPGHDNRQYGMLDVLGRTLTYSGPENAAWAGGQTGQVGDLVYAVQGNILTGAPVVQAAVDAVVTTPGDIPEKLMAAMEAAYLFGGDGRCSCDAGPTDCGSPPDEFEKSAHIGYMLIARAGDTDGCNQIVDTRGLPSGFVVSDLDGDGMLDVVTSTSSGEVNMAVLRNVTAPNAPLSSLAVDTEFESGGRTLKITGADFTGDGVLDVGVCSRVDDTVYIFPGLGGGAFAPGISVAVGDSPVAIASGNFDNQHADDFACVSASGSVSIGLSQGDGTFAVSSVSPVANSGTSIVAKDLTGDGAIDLALAHQSVGIISTLVGDGAGGFSPGSFHFVGPSPSALVCDDFNADGLFDLATPGDGSVTIMLNTGSGFARTDVPSPGGRRVAQLACGSLGGDASPDLLAVVSQPASLVSLINDGAGVFAFGTEAPIPAGVSALGAGDINADGLDDALVGASGVGGMVVAENQGGGAFLQELGCAAGDYFMTFNVPNTTNADPDPVITLREMFDDWRADLVGRPDAVRSIATGPSSIVASGEGESGVTIRVELRDWMGGAVDLDAGAISASLRPGSDGVLEVGQVTALGGGAYEIELIAGGKTGGGLLEIVADDGVRPVTLMPAYAIEVLDSRVDFDGDGVAGFGDVIAFLQAFSAKDPSADLDASGTFDADDVLTFLSFFSL